MRNTVAPQQTQLSLAGRKIKELFLTQDALSDVQDSSVSQGWLANHAACIGGAIKQHYERAETVTKEGVLELLHDAIERTAKGLSEDEVAIAVAQAHKEAEAKRTRY